MRNFVAKNDYNRAATHKSARDYSRPSKHDILLDIDLDDLGLIYCDFVEDHILEIEQPPKQEVSKWDIPSRN